MRTLVCGGRRYRDRERLYGVLDARRAQRPDFFLIVGYDPKDDTFQGADQLAYEWAKARGVPGKCYPAHWSTQHKSAGPRRNQRMIDMGKPEAGIAFPGGVGTADMCRRLDEAGISVEEIR